MFQGCCVIQCRKTVRDYQRSLGTQHVLWADPLCELLLVQVSKGDGLMFQGCSILVCSLGNLCSSIISNVGVEGCNKHEGLVKQPVDLLPVGHDAHHTVGGDQPAALRVPHACY